MMKQLPKSYRISIFAFVLFSVFTLNNSWAQATQCDDPTPLYVSSIVKYTTAATFTWDNAVPETGLNYQWEIRTEGAPGNSATTGYVVSGSAPNGRTSITVRDLNFETTYYFYVRYKCDATSYSPWQPVPSNQFVTEGLDIPTATDAIFVFSETFIAKWNPVLGATSYLLDVYTKDGLGDPVYVLQDLSVSNIYHAVTGLTEDTEYFYTVRAVGVNTAGTTTTVPSNEISVTTSFDVPNTTTWIQSGVGTNGTWSNGAPDAVVDAIIDWPYNTSIDGSIECKTLTVNAGSVLTIQSPSSSVAAFVEVYGPVFNQAGVNGIVIESNGNLLQYNDFDFVIENVGDITVKRNSNPLYRLDYTMWSSPVLGSQTLEDFSPETTFDRFYSYDTMTDKFSKISSGTIPSIGSGYLIRMPNNWVSYPGTAATWTGVFKGVPNASNINVPLNPNGNGYNMIGNPYTSAVSTSKFFQDNNRTTANIGSTIYFWRRQNNITGAGTWNSFYASRTYLGGTAVEVGGVETSAKPGNLISKGQGFIVKDGANSNNFVVFDNAQRNKVYPATFFRNANKSVSQSEDDENDGLERNRLWLNASSAEGAFGQTLIGYMTDATNGVDFSDGEYFNDGTFALTSLLDNKEYIIQGRTLPFDENDIVPLLFKTPNAGEYTISLDEIDGLFAEGQAIYIKDNLTNTVNNLNEGPYNFSSEVGVFPARFEVVYNTSSLSTTNPTLDANSVVVYKSNQALNINSGAIAMKSVELYDMSGRVIYQKANVDNTKLSISNLNFQDQIIIIKINTATGIVNKKYSFTR